MAPVAASLDIVRQVCLGLNYAHSLQSATGQPLGIIHRDISPSNLMLSFHGGVKILDFGIARVAEELRETHTQAGTMKGKVSYMSPEQIRMEPVDSRADIFAVGVVLHEMLTGRRLFKATNEFTGARMVLESVVALPSTVNPEVTPEVDRVVMRALERNRDARYLTAGEMAEDLEKLLFEMRASPHEPRKLLAVAVPAGTVAHGRHSTSRLHAVAGAVSSGELTATRRRRAIGLAVGEQRPPRRCPTRNLEDASRRSSLRSGARPPGAAPSGASRCSLVALLAVVVAVIVLAHPPWAVAR